MLMNAAYKQTQFNHDDPLQHRHQFKIGYADVASNDDTYCLDQPLTDETRIGATITFKSKDVTRIQAFLDRLTSRGIIDPTTAYLYKQDSTHQRKNVRLISKPRSPSDQDAKAWDHYSGKS